MSTYGTDFKILRFSKPTVEGTSRINPHFLRGSRAFYHIARPSCSEFRELGWALLRSGRVLPRRDEPGRWGLADTLFEILSFQPGFIRTQVLAWGLARKASKTFPISGDCGRKSKT